jgi:hypothetical protein
MSVGRTGYEAYAAHTGGKTFDGRDMPSWDALPDRIRNAWGAAALAIIAHQQAPDTDPTLPDVTP